MPAPKPVRASELLDSTLRIIRTEIKRLRRAQGLGEPCSECGLHPALPGGDLERLIKLTSELRQIEKDLSAMFDRSRLKKLPDAQLQALLTALASGADEQSLLAMLAIGGEASG